MQYQVYYYQEKMSQVIKKYPDFMNHLLTYKDSHAFYMQQLENVLENHYQFDDLFYQRLSLQKGYQRIGHYHYLKNELTHETIICHVHKHYLSIISHTKSNIFFDILYEISQRYVIISKQV